MNLIGTIWEINDSTLRGKEYLIFYSENILHISGFWSLSLKSWTLEDSVIKIIAGEESFFELTLENNLINGYFISPKWNVRSTFNATFIKSIYYLFQGSEGLQLFFKENFFDAYILLKSEVNIKSTSDMSGTDTDIKIFEPIFFECEKILNQKAKQYFSHENYEQTVRIYDVLRGCYKYSEYLEAIYKLQYPNKEFDAKHPICRWYTSQYEKAQKKISLVPGFHPIYDFRFVRKAGLTRTEWEVFYLGLYDENDYLKFGKYKKHKIEDVISLDLDYIFWCIFHLVGFVLSPKLLVAKSFRYHQNYYKAIEINLVKFKLWEKWEEEEFVKAAKYDYNFEDEELDYIDAYGENFLIDEGFEGDESNLWNID